MQLSDYLSPVSESVFNSIQESSPRSLINVADIYIKDMPDTNGADLAIIGVEEDRVHPAHEGSAATPDQVRKHVYQLVKHKYIIKVMDLGNIRPGATVNDSLFALNSCVNYLLERKVLVIILGGTQDLAYAQYAAYQGLQYSLNMVAC